MSFTKEKRTEIVFQLAKAIKYQTSSTIPEIAKQIGVSKQTAYTYIKKMLTDGVVVQQEGKQGYCLAKEEHILELNTAEIEEGTVWITQIFPLLGDINKNCRDILQYGFEEILNNAIEHSESETVCIRLMKDYVSVGVVISDKGIGIFEKIKQAFHLPLTNYAILELDKGKCTTDPDRHTGEGIFFSSKMFDTFLIRANSLLYLAKNKMNESFIVEHNQWNNGVGTTVIMDVCKDTTTKIQDVFDSFSGDDDDRSFNKTVVSVIHLIDRKNDTDMKLFSRSQARRLLNRFDRFKQVVLDFEGITEIGQGFADEVFRVYPNMYPEVAISYIHANNNIEKMIRHVKANKM